MIHAAHAPYSVVGMKPFPDKLYVITPINNPERYLSRWRLFRAFEKHMQDSGVVLYVVEAAFGGREYEVTTTDNPRHIRVRGGDRTELWLKENLFNIGLSRLPPEAKYVAMVDGDLTFLRPDWAQETLHALQHYHAVQMFSEIVNLSHEGEMLSHTTGFVEGCRRGVPMQTGQGTTSVRPAFLYRKGQPTPYPGVKQWPGSPGGAWAYRREALDAVGGLVDFSITGSADYLMVLCLFGVLEEVHRFIPNNEKSSSFLRCLRAWQERAVRHLRKNIGVVSGTIAHAWHGKMIQRGYAERWKILVQHDFDPNRDLVKDSQGLSHLYDGGTQRFIDLRADLRDYFRSRNEDGTDR